MNSGEARLIRPSMGSWVTYGLGSENQNLPGFIAMCPGGYPIQETQNWQAGFLPGAYQGTYIDTRHTSIDRLIENIRNPRVTPAEQRQQLDLLLELNQRHQRERPNDAQLEAVSLQPSAVAGLLAAHTARRSSPAATGTAGSRPVSRGAKQQPGRTETTRSDKCC